MSLNIKVMYINAVMGSRFEIGLKFSNNGRKRCYNFSKFWPLLLSLNNNDSTKNNKPSQILDMKCYTK